jgi:hypothetical protein
MSGKRNLISSLIEPDYRTQGWRDSIFAPRRRGGRSHAITGLAALIFVLLCILLVAADPRQAVTAFNNPINWVVLPIAGFVLIVVIGLILRAIIWLFIRPRDANSRLISAERRRARNFRQGTEVASLLGIVLGLTLYHTPSTRPWFAFLGELSPVQAMIVPASLGMLALLVPLLILALVSALTQSRPQIVRSADEPKSEPAPVAKEHSQPDPSMREHALSPSLPPTDSIEMQLEVRRKALRLHHASVAPDDFEQEVAWLINVLTRNKAVVVGGSGDGGIDIKVFDRKERLVGIVQCKRYNPDSVLPPGYVRELHSVKLSNGVGTATLVTTARFSDQTRQDAKELGIDLVDGSKLTQLKLKARAKLKTV